MARLEYGDPRLQDRCPGVRSHAPRVNRRTRVNQNSSLSVLIAAIDAFFQALLSLEGWLLMKTL